MIYSKGTSNSVKQKNTLLLICQSDGFSRDTKSLLLVNGFLVREQCITAKFERISRSAQVDGVVICSSHHELLDGIHLVERLKIFNPSLPVFMIARYSNEKKAIAALRSGVNDYFPGSITAEEFAGRIRHHLNDASMSIDLQDTLVPCQCDKDIVMVGESRQMITLKEYLGKVAHTDSTVLITGETGTGKELAASFIHRESRRHKKAFVELNASAMPENLVESELFGYEKGAFTGATATTRGKFEQASGGTLFLDEIGDMMPMAQAKILRVLENQQVYRLGSKKPVPIDVRVVAATNQDLDLLVEQGTFRKDLYFRLNVARVELPPLRERREDIPVLLEHFVGDFNSRLGHNIRGFTEKAWVILLHYHWPGNVRELKNVLEAAYINGPRVKISFHDLPRSFRERLAGGDLHPKTERDRVLSALFSTNWNKSKAAEKLNWSRMTLYRKMAKHQIVEKRTKRERLGGFSIDNP